MISIKTPFRFTGGRVSTTDLVTLAVEQKIINFLVTNKFERIMLPRFGGNALNMVMESQDPLLWADYKTTVLSELTDYVSGVTLKDLSIQFGGSLQTPDDDTTVQIIVKYQIPPLTAGTLVIPVDVDIVRNYL